LVLKRCKKDNVAYNGFIYPPKGEIVECQDWKDNEECGNGLHGWTLGFDIYYDDGLVGNFVVIKVDKKDGYVELEDKVKFKKGKVMYNGPDVNTAHAIMLDTYPIIKLHWNTSNQWDSSTSNQGDRSTSNQGYSSVSVHRLCSNASSIIRFSKNSVAILFNDNSIPTIYSEFKNETVYFYDCKPVKKIYNNSRLN